MAEVDGGSASGAGEVTFINGQAVEQTTEGESHEGTDRGDELAEAKAAVKRALQEDAKEEGKKAAKEAKAARSKDPLVPRDRNADGTFVHQDPVESEKEEAVKSLKREAEEEASALRKALSERKEVAKYKKEAAAHLERERNEVRQVHARLQQQQKQVQADQERIALYRKDPIRAIRENGYANPEDFILDIAQEGTPEGQARRAQRELLERLDRAESWQKAQVEQVQRERQEQESRKAMSYREQVERDFLTEASKHESLVGMYKGHEVELIGQADIVAEKYRAATGKEATFGEIAEYIAERHEAWYKSRSSKVRANDPAAASQADVISAGRPTPGSSTGKKRPMSPSGSERRSLGTSFADLDGDERLEAAKTAVRAAIHASGER